MSVVLSTTLTASSLNFSYTSSFSTWELLHNTLKKMMKHKAKVKISFRAYNFIVKRITKSLNIVCKIRQKYL